MRPKRYLTDKEIGMRMKIGLVFYCAALMKREMTYHKAQRIANDFTIDELTRIYKELKRRT
jgi:oligoendopeptidase F